MPRDYWTQVIDIDLPAIVEFERPSGGEDAIAAAAKLLSAAKFPVILNGAGVVHRRGHSGVDGAWPNVSMRRSAWAISTMTPSPARIRCLPGRLGYNGSKAAMELISQADVVLCLGTRLNPFSTLPGYGLDYWPKDAKIIQVDINPESHRADQEGDGRHCGRCEKGGRGHSGASLSPYGRRCRAQRTQGN